MPSEPVNYTNAPPDTAFQLPTAALSSDQVRTRRSHLSGVAARTREIAGRMLDSTLRL